MQTYSTERVQQYMRDRRAALARANADKPHIEFVCGTSDLSLIMLDHNRQAAALLLSALIGGGPADAPLADQRWAVSHCEMSNGSYPSLDYGNACAIGSTLDVTA